jgi:hypothetical protein
MQIIKRRPLPLQFIGLHGYKYVFNCNLLCWQSILFPIIMSVYRKINVSPKDRIKGQLKKVLNEFRMF